MTTHPISVERDQTLTSAERCAVAPNVLQAVGSAVGHQVRIKNPQKWDALYTVGKQAATNDIVGIHEDQNSDPEVGVHGLLRLGMPIGTTTGFNGTLDSQVIGNEFIEDAKDDGTNTWSIIAIAPHGGMIEPHTDEQAVEVWSHLGGKGVSYWLCQGSKAPGAPSDPDYGEGGAKERWHITSTDISAESFPKLKGMISRGFKCAVAFHGFEDASVTDDVIVGGLADGDLKDKIVAAIMTVVSPKYTVRKALASDPFNGDALANIVNRLTTSGTNGIQIEQKMGPRKDYGLAIADKVADIVYAYCVGTGVDTQAPATTCVTSPVPNAQGWNNSNVTITLHATDNPGGSGIASITYSLNGVQQPPEQKDTVTFQVATEGQTVIAYHAVDKANNTETPEKSCTVRLDKTPPTVTVASPADGATFTLNQQVNASYSCNDAGGSGLKSCVGTVPSGSPLDTSTFGTRTVTVTAEDNAGNKTTKTITYNVFFNFSGFFPPVDNWPKLNKLNAGANVPVKFSLGGNQGLDIFAQGYPKSQEIPCNNPNVEVAGTDPTSSPGGSGLTYNAGSDQYHYNWKTEKGWEGTCRQLVVKLKDGSFHRANFQFT